MLKHAENTMVMNPKTLDFSRRSEFLVATGSVLREIRQAIAILIEIIEKLPLEGRRGIKALAQPLELLQSAATTQLARLPTDSASNHLALATIQLSLKSWTTNRGQVSFSDCPGLKPHLARQKLQYPKGLLSLLPEFVALC
jgi:hypothetical protein